MLSSLRAWIIAGRFFALPWIAVNTFLGVKLAGFDINAWLLSFAIVFSILLSAHYMNAWRDWARGVDSIEEGSKAKPYTAASQLIPRGEFTVKEAKAATVGWLLVGIGLFILFAPKRIDTIALLLLGIFVAVTYSDFWKVKGLGEIALFLGHGFGACTFAYSMVKPITLEALVAGAILGMWAGVIYTIDQWQDVETDFAKRVKNYAYMIAKANMRISTFYYFAVSAIITMHFGFVLMGFLPISTLKTILLLPLFHFTGVLLDYHFEKGVLIALLGMWLYPILMIL